MDKINWINGQAGGTPLSAENLNLMQDNAENAINEVNTNLNTKITGTTLFDDPTGSRNITLSDSVANYDYLDIYDAAYNCHRIFNPTAVRSVNMEYLTFYTSGTTFRHFCSTCTMSGTSITLSNGYFYDNGGYKEANNSFLIKKVIGYKY